MNIHVNTFLFQLENMNQVVMIQNDSIAVTQNELKSLYKKQQEKVSFMQELHFYKHEKTHKCYKHYMLLLFYKLYLKLIILIIFK